VGRSGARGKPLGNELDRVDVSAAVVQGAAEVAVEEADVAVVEAAGISDLAAKVGGHLVHEAEGAAVRRVLVLGAGRFHSLAYEAHHAPCLTAIGTCKRDRICEREDFVSRQVLSDCRGLLCPVQQLGGGGDHR
jgi:hypothetical protein